jgi:hypothetical protein
MGLSHPTEVIRKGRAGKPNEFGRRQRTRSLPITRSALGGRTIQICWLQPSTRIKRCWDARRVWWRRMPHSTPLKMRPQRRQEGSSVSAFLTARPKASNATRAEKALVPQRPEMAHRVRGPYQRGQTATWPRSLPLQGNAGSALVSSMTMSSTSVELWKSRPPLKLIQHIRPIGEPAGHPGELCSVGRD